MLWMVNYSVLELFTEMSTKKVVWKWITLITGTVINSLQFIVEKVRILAWSFCTEFESFSFVFCVLCFRFYLLCLSFKWILFSELIQGLSLKTVYNYLCLQHKSPTQRYIIYFSYFKSILLTSSVWQQSTLPSHSSNSRNSQCGQCLIDEQQDSSFSKVLRSC